MTNDGSWWLYVILADQRILYTGVTTNIERRYQEHLSGGPRCAKALRGCQHLEMVFSQLVGDKSRAHSLERRFKRLSRAKRLAVVEGTISLAQALPD